MQFLTFPASPPLGAEDYLPVPRFNRFFRVLPLEFVRLIFFFGWAEFDRFISRSDTLKDSRLNVALALPLDLTLPDLVPLRVFPP